MSYLRDEIFEQPALFERLLTDGREQVRDVARAAAGHRPVSVVFAARGSSDNASVYARYLMEAYLGLPVSSAAPSVYSLYRRPPHLAEALVIGISQSGQSPDVVGVVAEAQRQGALTVAITNDGSSPLARAAGLLIEQRAGEERSVAATKTYTSQLLALAMLVAEMSHDRDLAAGLQRVPEAARLALRLDGAADAVAGELANSPACLVIARGFNYATALELALKLKEMAYLFAEPYSSADFLHGPVALVERDLPALLLGVRGPAEAGILDLAGRLGGAGARTFALSDDPALLAAVRAGHALPLVEELAGIPEALSPLVDVIPGQLLALHLAGRRRGGDLDRPRGLSKVTRTE
ncbi:MAG: SIS domain-containing protein [Chloroflexota bacterium]